MKSFCIIIIILICNCAFLDSRIEIIKDDFNDTITYRMQNNRLGGEDYSSWLHNKLYLNIQKYEQRLVGVYDQKAWEEEGYIMQGNYAIIFTLIVIYDADNWMFIEEGESLVLLVDGKRIGFEGKGSSGNRTALYGGDIMEAAQYHIKPEQIRAIVNANEVRVKVIGSRHYIERFFEEENFESFRDFYNQFVTRDITGYEELKFK